MSGPNGKGTAKRPSRLNLSAMPPAKSTAHNRPKSVTFVVSGLASMKTINNLVTKWHDGDALGVEGLKLRALVYQLGHADTGIDVTPDQFGARRQAPSNLPIAVVQPLGGIPPKLMESPQKTSHYSVNFKLASINKKEDLADHQREWLDVLDVAGERKYTLELAIRNPEGKAEDERLADIRDQFEKILGQAYNASKSDRDSAVSSGSEQGYFLVFDQFASPPLHLASSQLLRSQELADWAKFIGRLALHPRIYLKLSPFPLSNLFKSTPLSQTRTADYLSSAVQAAADAASHLASTTESITGEDVSTLSPSSSTGADLSTTSPEERAAEVKRRLRIFLDVSLEAFGVDRLIWASTIGADHSTAAVLPGHAGQDEENVAKEWYELVRESLASMGLDEDSLEGIFSGNASKVYRT